MELRKEQKQILRELEELQKIAYAVRASHPQCLDLNGQPRDKANPEDKFPKADYRCDICKRIDALSNPHWAA